MLEIINPYQLYNQREHINCDIIEYTSFEMINLCYHIIGPTETQVEVRENTADLEVKLEKTFQSIF